MKHILCAFFYEFQIFISSHSEIISEYDDINIYECTKKMYSRFFHSNHDK